MQLFNWTPSPFPMQTSNLELHTANSSTSLEVHFPGKEWICQASSVLEINLGTLRSSGLELMFESGVPAQQG